jgi:alginate O-acetyltransferase complex protein AlgJ
LANRAFVIRHFSTDHLSAVVYNEMISSNPFPFLKTCFCLQFFCLISSLYFCSAAAMANAADTFSSWFADLAAKAESQQRAAIIGQEGWLFLTAELRHLGVGRFWGQDAKAASRAANPEAADPLPAILDFSAQLKRAGIELILMPVPPKAAIYPDKLPGQAAPQAARTRTNNASAAFYRICAEQGLKVLDLAPAFQSARTTDASPLYCRTDSHWSGRGCAVAAELLAKEIGARAWRGGLPKRPFKSEWRETEIQGDLAELVDPKAAPEKVRLRFVTDADSGAPAEWRESPIVLLGDSHTLVFHAGEDMHGTGAGLADQLALELGFSVDVVGVRGSGATPARINLLRRKDNMAGKKLVIWCFSEREFTQASGGWRLVPIIEKK